MAMEGKSIVKKSGIYLIGNLTSKIAAALLLPIYAVYVTAAELGSYDMVVTICSIITPLIFCCLWEAVLRFVLKETSDEKVDKYISSVLFYLLAIAAIVVIGGSLAKSLFKINYPYYFYVIAYVLFFGSAQVFQAIARATKHNQVYVVAGIVSTGINFLGVLLFVCYLKLGSYGLLTAAILGQVTIILIDCIGVKIWGYFSQSNINMPLLKHMLIFSMPLILNQIIMWLIDGFSKVVINIHIGDEANGLYSFASKFSTLITTLGSVVAMALFEEAVLASNSSDFGKKYGKAVSNLNKMFYTMITIAFPAIIIFYHIFAGQEYMASKFLVPVLLIYSIMMNFATNLGSVFQVIDKTKYQFITTLLGAIGSCGLSYALVLRLDMYGVVVGQLIGSIILVVSRLLFILRYVKINIDYRMIFMNLILFVFVVILSINQGIVFNIVLFIIVCGLEAFLNRAFISAIPQKVKGRLGR